MFWFYTLFLILVLLGWRVIFSDSRRIQRKIRQISSKQSGLYERIDKRVAHKESLKVQKDMELYRKIHLVSDHLVDDLKVDLMTLGISDAESYIHKSVKEGFYNTKLGLGLLLGSAIFTMLFSLIRMPLDFFPAVLKLCGIGYTGYGLFTIFSIKSVTEKAVKEHVVNVEKDFNKLFFHLYPYYSADDNNYRLGDVLGKFQTTNPQMEIMVNTIINDSKRSEEMSLQSVIVSYSSSIKIVDLASKLLKCVSGNKLGPQYLKSLYSQLIAEEDRIRNEREAQKQELYIAVLLITMVVTAGLSLIGTLMEMI